MEPTTLLYAKALSLQQLEDAVSADEAQQGPLTALGHTADKSAATFEFAMPPTAPLSLIRMLDGVEIVPPGKSRICSGFVWIGGNPGQVVAVR